METVRSSKTLANIYRTTLHNIPEDSHFLDENRLKMQTDAQINQHFLHVC
jgi:hypothetical protein